jgi:MFS family permease
LSVRANREVLRLRGFRLLLASRLLSTLSLQTHNVAVGWFVYDLTNSAWALGLVGLFAFAPAFAFALFTGHVADTRDRRAIIATAHTVSACCALFLAGYAWADHREVWPVYLVVLAIGTSRAFGNPAGQALVPNLVPREHLAAAIALNASVGQVASIAGPAMGGFLYVFGPTVVFTVEGTCLATAALLAFLIGPQNIIRAKEKVTLSTLLAGLTFIRSRSVVLGAISLDMVAVILGGATALLPIFARDILEVGPWGLGILRSAPAVGALCMGLAIARFPLNERIGPRLFQGVAMFGLATIGFGLSTSLYLSILCLILVGASDMVSVVIRLTLVQIETPDEMRGRVAAVNSIFIGASNELGAFESGALAALTSPVFSVVFGGTATLGVVALWRRLFPELRNRNRMTAAEPVRPRTGAPAPG